jgi:hypothetical protein
VITGQNLDYATYRERLKEVQLTDYLRKTADDPYPMGLAAAILLSLAAVEASDSTRICRQVMELVSVFSPPGVPRTHLYAMARLKVRRRFLGRAKFLARSSDDVDVALHAG